MANEKRLIDANEMKNNITEAMMMQFLKNGDQIALRISEMLCHFVDVTDTVDAVEVVRCKGCKHHRDYDGNNTGKVICKRFSTFREQDFYCAYGERKGHGQG